MSDALLTRIAELRAQCRRAAHPLAQKMHTSDLWIAASALHVGAAIVSADAIFEDTPGVQLIR